MLPVAQILSLAPGFLLGVTLHEFSHALAADRLGDPTARHMGRLSLNPARHLDLWGSLALLLIGFGWAKPVPVNAANFSAPRRDMAIVAIAGPRSNLVLAVAFSLLLRVLLVAGVVSAPSPVVTILVHGVLINVVLAIFNLIPLPPLDGSRILAAVVPEKWNYGFETVERLGPLILLGIMLLASATGVSLFGKIISPIAEPLFRIIIGAGWGF